jgi:hypothetical protein
LFKHVDSVFLWYVFYICFSFISLSCGHYSKAELKMAYHACQKKIHFNESHNTVKKITAYFRTQVQKNCRSSFNDFGLVTLNFMEFHCIPCNDKKSLTEIKS